MSDLDDSAARIYAERLPVTDPVARQYVLPAADGRRIFREEIVPELLAGPEPQPEPVVVALVGQHGAGKSRVASMIGGVLARRGGFVELDGDLYRPYHPAYDALVRHDDRLMARYLGPDAWAWLAQAREYVREQRINALTHETANDGRGVAAHLRAYRQAGFRMEVMVMAVPAAMSNQGIVARYLEEVADQGHGRLSVQANADQAYVGVLDLADLIDREHLADYVGVFRRGESEPRYRNSLDAEGMWTAEPALRAAVERERERPWTAQETADFLRIHRRLRAELSGQWTARLDQILAQAWPHLDRQQERARLQEPARTREADWQLEAGA
jgi:energy-coupling factor transporter ATP-binding protein EcfA2